MKLGKTKKRIRTQSEASREACPALGLMPFVLVAWLKRMSANVLPSVMSIAKCMAFCSNMKHEDGVP